MAPLLALLSAVVYGVGDFCGGIASRRSPAIAIVLWSHVVGLALVLLSLPLVDGELRSRDLAIGALSGLAGAAGVGFLYQALAIGPMGIVAPITALLAAAVPVVVGVAEGERPAASVVLGMALAIAALVLVSADGGGSLRPSDPRAVLLALAAGLGFGLFFVALARTSDGAGTWPLLGARAASVGFLGLLAVFGRIERRVSADARGLTAIAGALDVAANLLYLLAAREGLLSVVAVLSALYPVSTVVLARIVLRERFAVMQRIGMALALPATILMAT